MPSITTVNATDSWLEIIPLNSSHAASIPSSLEALISDFPLGSFILKNKTRTPVTVIVAKWLYTDAKGNQQQLGIHCDAYLVARVDPLINANDLALVTPDACTRQEYFSRLRAESFLGSPLQSQRNAASLRLPLDSIAAVQISVDSVIFADGQIWGPDNLRYFRKIMERAALRQSVVDEITAAKASGEEMSSRLQAIEDEARSKKDKSSAQRGYYANLIRISPNPEGTLRALQQQDPLPEFRHIGEQK